MTNMQFSLSQSFIASNPRFALSKASRSDKQRGQRSIILDYLEEVHPAGLSLEQLVVKCGQRYRNTFKNRKTDIRKSILYHLNRIETVRQL